MTRNQIDFVRRSALIFLDQIEWIEVPEHVAVKPDSRIAWVRDSRTTCTSWIRLPDRLDHVGSTILLWAEAQAPRPSKRADDDYEFLMEVAVMLILAGFGESTYSAVPTANPDVCRARSYRIKFRDLNLPYLQTTDRGIRPTIETDYIEPSNAMEASNVESN